MPTSHAPLDRSAFSLSRCPKIRSRRKLVDDAVRPIIFFMRQGTCWQPEVKGLTLMENSIFNSWRMEDVWLDKQ